MMIRVPCPAKVNLFLSVGPRDERNYHPIRTLFQAIGLFDYLDIETNADADRISCNWPELPSENTLTKTLRLFREMVPTPPLRIHLEKNIPALTGLGGGSSDAAGLLRGLSFLAEPAPNREFLRDVAAAVGKDVPFFLVGGKARGEGYGECLVPLPDPDPAWFVIVRPQVDCSTAEAYAKLDSVKRPFLDFDERSGLYNDFERVAPSKSLEYVDVLQAYGAMGAMLCGSGSGVFGVFEEETSAKQAIYRLSQDSRIRTWLASSLTREESLKVETVS
jgi:4-diphosphocytidyl-2-C-methyl-D-erythritol kinase